MARKNPHKKLEKTSDLSKPLIQKQHTSSEEPKTKEILVDEMVQATETQPPGKSWSRKRRFIFALGFGLGAIIAARLKPIVENQDIGVYVDSVREYLFHDLDLSTLLPSNISPDFIFNNLTSLLKTEQEIGDFLPGKQLVLEGVKAKHPVILVPGIISTGLESWSTSDCALKYFRKRLWGTATMLRAVLLDKQCWIQNMKLDPITGLDPTDVKLRAAQGLDAADYFITGYWIWGKVIENLAAIGYDNNNMHLAGYDWRLGFADLEVRDQHFTRMKNTIELAKMYTGEKAVLVGHSMGSNVIYYFLKWVESEKGGNGGPNWVNDYIHTFVNIAGPMLGVPKTLSSLLSGEQRETVQPVANYVLEQFFSRRERAELFRTWGGVASMMPKGGNYVWGDESSAPDDSPHIKHSYGPIISFSQGESVSRNLTLEDALDLLFKTGDDSFKNYFTRLYGLGFSNDHEELMRDDPTAWANPLDSQLPNAPDMKIYCLHGVGKLTERQYYYTADQVEPENAAAAGADESKSSKILPKELLNPNIYIDTNVHQADYNISSGIVESDGDGTVPLISLGYMCSSGWKKPQYNPSGIKVVTREFEHELTKFDLRGGVKTADHVDILGNYALTDDLLRIVSGKDEDLDDIIHSKILEYSANIDKRIETNSKPKPSGSWW